MNLVYFCSSVFVRVGVFNVWLKTTLLPVWPQNTKRLDTPELNKMKIINLSEAEFTTLVIRMLQELSEDLKSIKKSSQK